jgi:hypothetical protein
MRERESLLYYDHHALFVGTSYLYLCMMDHDSTRTSSSAARARVPSRFPLPAAEDHVLHMDMDWYDLSNERNSSGVVDISFDNFRTEIAYTERQRERERGSREKASKKERK